MEENKWKKYRTEYCKVFRLDNPDYHCDYYQENKEKFNEYIKKRAEQKQRIKAGLEPLPRIKRTKRELAKMREEHLLKSLKIKAEKFKQLLNIQNTN
jgi:hypothetical protein